MGQKSIGLYREEDKQAWKEAEELARKDLAETDGFDEPVDPTDAEVLAHICNAYTGNI